MHNRTKNQIKELSIIAMLFAFLVIIPSVKLLFSMITGTDKDVQYGYSMHILFLAILGSIPSIVSIIISIQALTEYRNNKYFLPVSIRILTSSALSISIISLVLIIIDSLLSMLVFH